MITKLDWLEAYKKAIKLKFEEEKQNEFSSYLEFVSRAKLRQLCVERFRDCSSSEDLKSFTMFFKFEFNINTLNKLKSQTDKFRPIETFLKGETDLTDIEAINIAAILVNFSPRPFRKFCSLELIEKQNKKSKINNYLKFETKILTSNFNKKKLVLFSIGIVLFITLFTFKGVILNKNQCMQWQTDHYVTVNCEVKGLVSISNIEPLDKQKLILKRIYICKTTPCWVNNKAVIWYCKVGNKPQFFNTHGVHPETGKALKPISEYIFNKYVKNKN